MKFPSILNKNMILPVFKAKDKLAVNNYRPICISLTASKIIESVMYGQIEWFLDKQKIMNPTSKEKNIK